MKGTIDFLHYHATGNIGDLLCSPRHYFDFEAERDTLIVGGGASNSFFAGRARMRKARVRVGWGIGQSWRFGQRAGMFKSALNSIKRYLTYDLLSTRDPSMASPSLPLVPCVSVFHPITEIPCGDSVGIFLNGDQAVSGPFAADTTALAKAFGKPVIRASNEGEVERFAESFSQTMMLITNSYHAAYWGLLSGRQVHVIGYSSKFVNLVSLFGFEPDRVIAVERGNVEDLANAIKNSAEREPLQCKASAGVRDQFRAMNLEFAGRLASVGVRAIARVPGDRPQAV